MTERHHDISLAVGGGSRWMSYREIAEARGDQRGLSGASGVAATWPRQPGNDGSTRVAVP